MDSRVVLVTGGSRGIGRETARAFGREGAAVWITGRNEAVLAETAEKLSRDGISVRHAVSDVRDPESCRKLIDRIIKEDTRLDVAVCNAGMSMRGTAAQTDVSVFRTMMEINYLGAVHVVRYALEHLIRTRGSVICISTVAALHGLPGTAAYGASKIALRTFTEALRSETASSGLHVGLVHVGFTENDSGKVVYDAKGNLVQLERRRNSHTQQQTARCILACAAKRKSEMTLTPLGKAVSLLYRLSPRLSDFLVSRSAAGRSMDPRR